ncbi:hypothetical protein CO082_03650 [Candidatus Peregrinibacteria bacterium CG_4_9_14_0_8_um_filter_44_15]|nr:MAG: hypothetical protein AUK45_05230 [Candidatus Peregrinibacteria bacterium CG2_30_44_17]PJB88706.1 MAG: hypothetical protein CO082_03650 [Candidatus Peregrinibacteria bacterium CG_4_9_14_0_8_um_filter_44_15]
MTHPYSDLSADLKSKCLKYIRKYLSEDFRFYMGDSDTMFIGDENELEGSMIFALDNFLLFGNTIDEDRVITQIREDYAKLNDEEKEILKEWEEGAITSLFEVEKFDKDNMGLLELLTNIEYTVYSNTIFPEKLDKGSFVITNIVPIKGAWFLSGAQKILPAEEEESIYRTLKEKGGLSLSTNPRFQKYFYRDIGVSRNDPCPCGGTKQNGKPIKFKKCCGR